MTENERLIRKLYEVAEVQDAAGFAALFADDGYFWDVPAGQKYVGKDIEKPVAQYATAFPDMDRELGHVDLYDKPAYVQPAVDRLAAFYRGALCA